MAKRRLPKRKKRNNPLRIRHKQRRDAVHDWARLAVMVRSQFAALTLRAVIDTGERSFDGDLILAVLPAWDEIVRWIENDPDCVLKIDPYKWEQIVAASYERQGFDEVRVTPRSGDFGRDIVAVKRGLYSVRRLWKSNRRSSYLLVRSGRSFTSAEFFGRSASVKPSTS